MIDTQEAGALLNILRQAADHHSESPARYDLGMLAGQAAVVAPHTQSLWETLLSNPAVIALLVGLLTSKLRGRDDKPGPLPPAPTPITIVPIVPIDSPKLLYPSDLQIDLDLFLAEGVPAPYRVVEREDYYEIVKTDGTEALPIHGGAYLHAVYLDDKGLAIDFDARGATHLNHTAVWTARVVGQDGQGVFAGPGNPAKEGGDRDIANFRLAEYERTRGMDVPIHFPPTANESVVEVGLSVETTKGMLLSKPIRFPRID